MIERHIPLTPQNRLLLQSFSLLILGIFLATLATLNFSLSLIVGILSAPLSFVGSTFSGSTTAADVPLTKTQRMIFTFILQMVSPTVVTWVICFFWGTNLGEVLVEAAFGWQVNGLWTQVVVWCVWWPAWLAGSVLVGPL